VTGIGKAKFISEHIRINELGNAWQLRDYQQVVLDLMWRKRYAIRIYSEPKKSGKSHLTECLLVEDLDRNICKRR
jgi:hypothetical protein